VVVTSTATFCKKDHENVDCREMTLGGTEELTVKNSAVIVEPDIKQKRRLHAAFSMSWLLL